MTGFSRFAQACEAAATRLGQALSAIAALAVGAIVVVLAFSSIQRYVLARPFPATEEIAAYLFVAMSFLSMLDGLMKGRHIRLLPVWKKLPPGLQGWAMVVGNIATLSVIFILLRETFAFAARSYRYGSRSYVADLLEWPWMMIIPFALATLGLGAIARTPGDIDRIRRGEPLPESPDSADQEAL